MSARNSCSLRYCISSKSKTNAVPLALAASATARNNAERSACKFPLSPVPNSGSISIERYSFPTLIVPRKLRKTLNARFTFSFKPAMRSILSRASRNGGASNSGKLWSSGVSMKITWHPKSSAVSAIVRSNTVFPTPRNPTSKRLFSERNARTRSTATRAFSKRSCRPTKAGGGVPAPGENGFNTTFIMEI